jgi:hypothetical protein
MTPAATNVLQGVEVSGVLINRNNLYITDVSLDVDAPQMLLAAADLHPYRMLLWNSLLFGLQNHGTVEPKVFPTLITGLPEPVIIKPDSETRLTFTATPPIMQPRALELWVHALAGQIRLAAAPVRLEVTVPEFAAFVLPVRDDVKAVYFILDNRAGKKRNINIEFALNKGKSTLAAELLGPLSIPADTVAVFAHEYRLSPAALAADRLSVRIDNGRTAGKMLR